MKFCKKEMNYYSQIKFTYFKNKCYYFFWFFVNFICVVEAQDNTLNGYINANMDSQKIYLLQRSFSSGFPHDKLIDSSIIMHNKFNFKYAFKEPTVLILKKGNTKKIFSFLFEKGTKVVIKDSSFVEHTIINSQSDDDWQKFTLTISNPISKYQSKILDEVKILKKIKFDSLIIDKKQFAANSLDNYKLAKTEEFIINNPNSFASLHILDLYWDQLKNNYELLGVLSDTLKNHSRLQRRFSIKNQNENYTNAYMGNFTSIDINGTTIESMSYKGKFLLLDFWGTWCQPCIQSIPKLRDISKKHTNDLEIISIAEEKTKNVVFFNEFIKNRQMNWTHIIEIEENQTLAKLYNIAIYPTYILLDKEGKVILRTTGSNNFDKIQQILDSAN